MGEFRLWTTLNAPPRIRSGIIIRFLDYQLYAKCSGMFRVGPGEDIPSGAYLVPSTMENVISSYLLARL